MERLGRIERRMRVFGHAELNAWRFRQRQTHVCAYLWLFLFWSVSLFAFARVCFAERGHVHTCFDKGESRTKPHLLTQREETTAVHRFTPPWKNLLVTDWWCQTATCYSSQAAAFLATAAVLELLFLGDVQNENAEDCFELSWKKKIKKWCFDSVIFCTLVKLSDSW